MVKKILILISLIAATTLCAFTVPKFFKYGEFNGIFQGKPATYQSLTISGNRQTIINFLIANRNNPKIIHMENPVVVNRNRTNTVYSIYFIMVK